MKIQETRSFDNYLLRGFWVIFQPEVRRLAIAPVLISAILYSLFIASFFHWMSTFSLWVTHFLPSWLSWAMRVTWPLLLIAHLIFALCTFTLIVNIISAPFNVLLAKKVEKTIKGDRSSETIAHEEGKTETRKNRRNGYFSEVIGIAPQAFWRELLKAKYFFLRALPLLALGLVPIVNLAVGLFWIIFGSWTMAIQYLDYPMENHKTPFDASLSTLKTDYLANIGFGVMTLVISFIPLVNLFIMPAAISGGTLKFLEEKNDKKSHTSSSSVKHKSIPSHVH
jgi:CysZ protein